MNHKPPKKPCCDPLCPRERIVQMLAAVFERITRRCGHCGHDRAACKPHLHLTIGPVTKR